MTGTPSSFKSWTHSLVPADATQGIHYLKQLKTTQLFPKEILQSVCVSDLIFKMYLCLSNWGNSNQLSVLAFEAAENGMRHNHITQTYSTEVYLFSQSKAASSRDQCQP